MQLYTVRQKLYHARNYSCKKTSESLHCALNLLILPPLTIDTLLVLDSPVKFVASLLMKMNVVELNRQRQSKLIISAEYANFLTMADFILQFMLY